MDYPGVIFPLVTEIERDLFDRDREGRNVMVSLPSQILREAGTGIEPVNSGFADRGLTTWLPRRIALSKPISPAFTLDSLWRSPPIVANFRKLSAPGRMSGQGLRFVPYAGHKGYQCYLDGWKVNGKRKRLPARQPGLHSAQSHHHAPAGVDKN